MRYAYICPTHGFFEVPIAADSCLCPDCGDPSRRSWSVSINTRSARANERYWDPQVGAVVGSQREFNDLLKAGAERESAELNMECRLTSVDARDLEARGELHGTGVDHILAEQENTAKVHHDERVKANHEEKPKVLRA